MPQRQSSNLVPDEHIETIASVTEGAQPHPQHSGSPTSGDPRIVSGVSSVSQREQSHLRNLSDATFSSVAAPSEATEGGWLSRDDAAFHQQHQQQQQQSHVIGGVGGTTTTTTHSPMTPILTNDFSSLGGTPPGPVSPPSGDDRGGPAGDYLNYQPLRSYPTADLAARARTQMGQQQQQGQGSSAQRKSVFRESREDLDGNHGEGR
jgi:hypothetical protein